ncbi:DNA double-strand break repair nuclease NurA [Helicobacter suis]|uniref:DNA double-strand break repair nuclease NurA n=1 Tax=Helicobacter suis TaxID=104628 RepID=UPI001F07E67F|nr:DNA double-strand break repair nuclease NurA [Helicobacter suis]
MGYPGERASKINHREIVESEEVRAYLARCEKIPPRIDILNFDDTCIELSQINNQLDSHIERVVVVDGSCAEVPINQEFPSYKLCYYIIGICTFPLKNLETLENKPTIDHLDIKELENYERFTFVMPMQNIRLEEKDFTTTFRETLYEIFKENGLNEGEYSLLDTLKWLVFQEYSSKKGSIKISCWHCEYLNNFSKQIEPYQNNQNDFQCCPNCQEKVYITDYLALHTLIDEARGATGAQSYIMSVCEVVLMLSMFRYLFEEKQNTQWLPKILFIKDGPLVLFSRLDNFASETVRPFLQFLYERSLKEHAAILIGLD